MDREAIEFHDSVLARVDRSGENMRFLFEPAYVHRSSGDPARDAGTGWSVNVTITIYQSHHFTVRSELPANISDGTLVVDGRKFQNVVPLPFEDICETLLTIELSTGEIVKVSGKGLELIAVGTYEFVEDVAAV